MGMLKWKNFKGSTFLEVLVVVSITAFVLIAMINASIVAIIQTRYARNKVQANRLTQEGLNWLRAMRDRSSSWDEFIKSAFGSSWEGLADGSQRDYCLATLDFSTPYNVSSCGYISNTKFKRRLKLVVDKANNLLKVEVTTGWRDGLCKNLNDYFCHQVQVTTQLTPWQD